MASIRYLGSKARLAEKIVALISNDYDVIYDMFCGTGIISYVAVLNDYKAILNDNLKCATILAGAKLTGESQVSFSQFQNYNSAITALNMLDPTKGFIYNEYTPEGRNFANVSRKYFIPENGGKIDSIRNKIQDWFNKQYLSVTEYNLLIGDLLEATNRVANIAGTYGCFLSSWTKNSLNSIKLLPRNLMQNHSSFEVYNQDVFSIIPSSKENAVIYLDPPYTKRQYAAYYHILETISVWDDPIVGGKTGLREWKEKASPFSYKTKALNALENLLTQLSDFPVYLSYSSQGHISFEELTEFLPTIGKTDIHDLGKIGRYRPNKEASNNSSYVNEYLFEIMPN